MIYKESGKEYNHFYCYFGNKIGLALIGVDKDIEEEELGIFEDCQLQVYDELAAEIFKLKDLQDRAKLIGAIDDFKEKEKQDFHGTYWEIFLDFLLLEKGIKPHRLSVMLVEAITKDSFPKTFVGKDYYPEEIIKNIDSNLANLKKSKGNPHRPPTRGGPPRSGRRKAPGFPGGGPPETGRPGPPRHRRCGPRRQWRRRLPGWPPYGNGSGPPARPDMFPDIPPHCTPVRSH